MRTLRPNTLFRIVILLALGILAPRIMSAETPSNKDAAVPSEREIAVSTSTVAATTTSAPKSLASGSVYQKKNNSPLVLARNTSTSTLTGTATATSTQTSTDIKTKNAMQYTPAFLDAKVFPMKDGDTRSNVAKVVEDTKQYLSLVIKQLDSLDLTYKSDKNAEWVQYPDIEGKFNRNDRRSGVNRIMEDRDMGVISGGYKALTSLVTQLGSNSSPKNSQTQLLREIEEGWGKLLNARVTYGEETFRNRLDVARAEVGRLLDLVKKVETVVRRIRARR
ncbi:MAG: hypothetical protein EXS63_08335 [Candidatus Omnitrophica bacterium]|nr:hypothetical protein [Candidatus Omnitrophota bacterium]